MVQGEQEGTAPVVLLVVLAFWEHFGAEAAKDFAFVGLGHEQDGASDSQFVDFVSLEHVL